MNILVLNTGSSSVKTELIEASSGKRLLSMDLSRLGGAEPGEVKFSDEDKILSCSGTHGEALAETLPLLKQKIAAFGVDGLGHRVVHGGEKFSQPRQIDAEVEAQIEELIPIAPLHNPLNLAGIRVAKKIWPDLPHIAVFDTAFHATLPHRAKTYAIPLELAARHGIRRYGFHGTSHEYVAHKAAEHLGFDIRTLRIITCHLGSGCSMAAVEYGRSIETSMGMTPLEGLVMGTRSGDIDPGVLIHLMKEEGMSPEALDRMLNKESGLKGLSGSSNDMRDLEEVAAAGDQAAGRAIQVFTHQVRKYIGAYAAVMGGADAIVFTAGIGENSAAVRERIGQRLEFLGALLDDDANRQAHVSDALPVVDISTSNSRCKLLVVATDEQYAIARQSARVIAAQKETIDTTPSIPIAISARHIHLTQETLEALFGSGYELKVRNWLSQPGQYAAEETVTLVGPKNRLERVRILGPLRSKNQIEISRTDEFFLGIDAPVRPSGQVDHTPGILLEGPKGSVSLPQGVICAQRHIHMTPADAGNFGVQDKDVVEVRIDNGERSLTFGDVLIRVSDQYKLEMHIDTDEGNAAELNSGDAGVLAATGRNAGLVRRMKRE